MPDHPSSPWPLLACINPSAYLGASYLGTGQLTWLCSENNQLFFFFFLGSWCICIFSCNYSPLPQEKAEFLEHILVCGGRRVLCACRVQLPLCAEPSPCGQRVSDALGKPLGRGGAGMCHNQVEKPHFRWRPASSSRSKNTAPGSGISPECAEMTPPPGKDTRQAGMDSFKKGQDKSNRKPTDIC